MLTGPIFTKEALDDFDRAQKEWKKQGGSDSGEPSPMFQPRMFWKIFKCGVVVEAVVMEQTTPKDSGPSGVSVKSVSVAEISKLTGLSFFGGMSEELRGFYLNTCRPKYGAKWE